MFVRIQLIMLKEAASEEQKSAIEQALTTMPEKIPGVESWSIGHNINPMFPRDH